MRDLQKNTTSRTVKVAAGPDFPALLATKQLRKQAREMLRQNVLDNAARVAKEKTT